MKLASTLLVLASLTSSMGCGSPTEPPADVTSEPLAPAAPDLVVRGRVLGSEGPIEAATVWATAPYRTTCAGNVFGIPVNVACLRWRFRRAGVTDRDGYYETRWSGTSVMVEPEAGCRGKVAVMTPDGHGSTRDLFLNRPVECGGEHPAPTFQFTNIQMSGCSLPDDLCGPPASPWTDAREGWSKVYGRAWITPVGSPTGCARSTPGSQECQRGTYASVELVQREDDSVVAQAWAGRESSGFVMLEWPTADHTCDLAVRYTVYGGEFSDGVPRSVLGQVFREQEPSVTLYESELIPLESTITYDESHPGGPWDCSGLLHWDDGIIEVDTEPIDLVERR